MQPKKPQLPRYSKNSELPTHQARRANASVARFNNVLHPVIKGVMKRNTAEGKVREAVDSGMSIQEADSRYKAAEASGTKDLHMYEIPVRAGALGRAKRGEPMDLITGVNPERKGR